MVKEESSSSTAATTATASSPETTENKCVPCEGLDATARLSLEQVLQRQAASLPLWQVKTITAGTVPASDDTTEIISLSRSFTARNFQAALDAMNAMGAVAERENHHPDFHLTSYRQVEVVIYTHSLQGVTENDIILATMLDSEIKVDYSPKWLQEHPEAVSTVKSN